ncbi:Uncharacterised protein [Yokenella regensburgei]|jgi:hypothetical protein|nr:hypothetical protein FHR25_001918 [Yokenella regensburgei]VFS36119.1 Uncharacterised protein [Yokenella regensburgei]
MLEHSANTALAEQEVREKLRIFQRATRAIAGQKLLTGQMRILGHECSQKLTG